MDEIAGATAINYGTLGTAANGTYTGVTLADAAAPGGGLCPYFDSTDLLNILTDTLVANIDPELGTFAIWVKLSSPATWTDSTPRQVLMFDFDNTGKHIYINKIPDYMVRSDYTNSGDAHNFDYDPNTYNWLFLASTWSIAADEFIAYKNGTALGAALTTLVSVAGTLVTAKICNAWFGWGAHCAIWDKVLTPTEINALYTGGL